MGEEYNNFKLKVGINIIIVNWDQPTIDVCVTTRG